VAQSRIQRMGDDMACVLFGAGSCHLSGSRTHGAALLAQTQTGAGGIGDGTNAAGAGSVLGWSALSAGSWALPASANRAAESGPWCRVA
jgi:hypothetical protein